MRATRIIARVATTQHPLRNFASGSPRVASLKGKSVLGHAQFTKDTIDELISVARYLKKRVAEQRETNDLAGKYLANVFYEPSTRTASSFQIAMNRLGGKVVAMNSQVSSVAKGETLADTIRVMQNYVDGIVIRHPEKGAAATAAKWSNLPVLNAGDGANEHPTQALLDMLCVSEEHSSKKLNGLTFTLLGDLKFGRTVHSMAPMLSHYGVRINLVSPPSLKMPDEYVALLRERKVEVRETEDLMAVLPTTDVLYVTRVQKERFADENEYKKVKGSYVIDAKTIAKAKADTLVLHPLPRVDEISTDLDADRRAMYFREPFYGMLMRMALLLSTMG